MITREKLLAMLKLQGEMNVKVNEKWISARYPWLRAVVVEGTEALEHLGWKWWKKQEPDVAQFRIELVDIWHFAMSDAIMLTNGNDELTADSILGALNSKYQNNGIMFDGVEHLYSKMSQLQMIELMIGLATQRRFSFPLFEAILRGASMSWDDLYAGYIAKNVLNFFRQDHGYKAGTYIKSWNLREDNEVMTELIGELDQNAPNFAADLRYGLSVRYIDVLRNNGRQAEADRIVDSFIS